jgi:cell division protein FtsQ
MIRPFGARGRRRGARGSRPRAARSPRAAAPAQRLRDGRVGAAVVAVSLLAGALLADRVVPVPRLRSLHVQGAVRLGDAELAAAAGVARGTDLRASPAREVARRLASHAWVRSARAARLPTGSLVLAVEEREPHAVLAGPEPRVVDAEGTPFARVAADAFPELPRLASVAPAAPGEPNPALAAAVQLAERLAGLGLPPAAEVTIGAAGDPEGSSLRLRGLSPRFLLGRDVEAALARLARLVDAGPPRVLLAATVDLRFQDQAVLRHEPLPEGTARAADPRGSAAPPTGRRAG